MTNSARIYCIGDTMLEFIDDTAVESQYQRTIVLDARSGALGGAVWNAFWYFGQLGRSTVVATHYGVVDRSRIEQAFDMRDHNPAFIAEKQSQTDALLVLRQVQAPAIYVAGALAATDIDRMLAGMLDVGIIVFTGSRNTGLRRRFLAALADCPSASFVFSPSYTLYEYPLDEVERFMRRSDLTFVNEHEAEYLQHALGKELPDLMSMPRAGGVVTKGARGATLLPARASPIEIPSVSGRTEDVIGAGEAFLCGFMHAFLVDSSWQWAGETGAEVAAQVVRDGRVRAPIQRARLPALQA